MFVCLYIHVRMNNEWILFICLKKDISVWDSIDESGVYCAKWSKHSSEEKYCLVTFIEVSGFCFPGTTHRTLYLDLSGVFEAQFCSQKQSPDFHQFDYLLFKCTANFMFVKLAYGFRDIVWTYFWFPYPLSTCSREPTFSYVNSILS